MVQLAGEWDLEVERGPDWLFVTVHPGDHLDFESPEMADQLWEVLNKHFTYRVVLDMDEVELMTSQLIGQLIMLLKRVLQHEGALRICHLRPACQDALRLSRLESVLPNYDTRAEAVLGTIPRSVRMPK